MKLNIYKRVNLSHPTMLAAFPGMGNVAIRAVNYVRRKLSLEAFAQIDVSEFTLPELVLVEKGVAEFPPMPRYVFYYSTEPEIIVFEGEAQLKGNASFLLIEEVLKLAKEFNVEKLFTGAAFPVPSDYNIPPKLYGVANTLPLRESLVRDYRLKAIDSGEIAGLNGILLGYAKHFKIPAACILATIPAYATNFPNPKASKAIMKLFEKILRVKISYAELDAIIHDIDRGMAKLEQKVLEHSEQARQAEGLDNENAGLEGEEIPADIRRRIEYLFYEARYNKERAYTLKKELDKWNLFEAYEDRFLDLFKKS